MLISLITGMILPPAGSRWCAGTRLQPAPGSACPAESGVCLRALRVRDCRKFVRWAAGEGDATIPEGLSGFGLWWWIHRRFDLACCIVADGTPRGIVGIYDAGNDKTAWVGLTIFDAAARRLGIGSTALRLLARLLRDGGVLRLSAEVKAGNDAAREFWTQNGFSVTAGDGDRTILTANPGTLGRR